MNTHTVSNVFSISLIVLMVGAFGLATTASAQYYSGDWGNRARCSPSLIQFTGTMVEPETPEALTVGEQLDVVVDSKKWIFLIEDARNLSCLESRLGIIKDIVPPPSLCNRGGRSGGGVTES